MQIKSAVLMFLEEEGRKIKHQNCEKKVKKIEVGD